MDFEFVEDPVLTALRLRFPWQASLFSTRQSALHRALTFLDSPAALGRLSASSSSLASSEPVAGVDFEENPSVQNRFLGLLRLPVGTPPNLQSSPPEAAASADGCKNVVG